MCKSFQSQLLFPMSPPDVVPIDHVELDFSDIVGPLPVQPVQVLNEISNESSESSVPAGDESELIYEDPVIIYSRSHSLVGPYSCVSQSLKLISKLTIHETEDAMEFLDCIGDEATEEVQELFDNDSATKELVVHVDDDSVKVRRIGLEDLRF